MAFAPAHIGNWRSDRSDRVRIKPGHGTRPVKWSVGGAGNTSALVQFLLGSVLRAQAGLIGGSRLHLQQAVNTGAANTLRLWEADLFTRQADGGTVALTASSSAANTITRTTGSFLADGWAIDDLCIVDGATTLANSTGAVVTGVTATTLTFAVSTFTASENLPAGALLWRGIQTSLSGLAANAGNAAGTAALNALTDGKPGVDTIVNNSAWYLGAGVALFAAVGTTLAAGAYVDLCAKAGDY